MNHHQTPQPAPTAAFSCLTPTERARFQHLQALEDAIAYRTTRLAAPCLDCGSVRCDDHATDTDLITAYRLTAAALAAQTTTAWPLGIH